MQGDAMRAAQAALDQAPFAPEVQIPPGLEAPPSRVHWAGGHDRARRLAGLDVTARLSSPRRRVAGSVFIDAQLDASI